MLYFTGDADAVEAYIYVHFRPYPELRKIHAGFD
jgi:hypothetical protein